MSIATEYTPDIGRNLVVQVLIPPRVVPRRAHRTARVHDGRTKQAIIASAVGKQMSAH